MKNLIFIVGSFLPVHTTIIIIAFEPRWDGVGLTTGGVLGDDGTGAGARATMPLINEGRTEMESRMTPFLSASYRADEAVIYSAHVPIRALPVLAQRSRPLLWPTTTKKIFEISLALIIIWVATVCLCPR